MFSRRNIKPWNSFKSREKLNWEYYNPLDTSTPANYCLDSSFDGVKYIGQQNRHCFERVFWFIAFTLSVACAGLLIKELWEEFKGSPIVTVFNPIETDLRRIAFPAVTFCNINKIKWSKGVEYFRNYDNSKDPYNETSFLKSLAVILDLMSICELDTLTKKMVTQTKTPWTTLFDKFTKDLAERRAEYEKFLNPLQLLEDGSQKCSEMIVFCMWHDEVRNCSELFRPIITDYGYCCTFNMIPPSLLMGKTNDSDDNPIEVKEWKEAGLTSDNLILPSNFDHHHKFPYRQQYSSRKSGLSVMLEPDLNEYSCGSTDSEGFMVGLNGPLDFPRMNDDGMVIPPGAETFIKIHPRITTSDKSIRKFPLEKRNCLFDDESEHYVQYYTKYTTTNCFSDCISNNTHKSCGCVQYYMPKSSHLTLCKPDMYDCATEVERNVTNVGACAYCYDTCTDIQYQTEVTTLSIRRKHLNKLFNAYPTKKRTDNLTIVHLYFGQQDYQTRLRKESCTVIDLISNAGGLLGLCMGFSMLSFLEIIYYWTIRIFFIYRRNRILKKVVVLSL